MYSIITFRDIGLTNITVYHGSAYTVVKVTSKPMENGKFGRVRTLKHLNQMTKFDAFDYIGNIKLKVITPLREFWNIGEILLRCKFLVFLVVSCFTGVTHYTDHGEI